MSTPRTLNSPADIENYPENRIVYRNNKTPDRIIECRWGVVYEDDGVTEKHPAESVSFQSDGQGGWNKQTELRLE